MNYRVKYALIAVVCGVGSILVPSRLLALPAAQQAPNVAAQGQKEAFEQRALAADRAFVEAAAKSDAAALEHSAGRAVHLDRCQRQDPDPRGIPATDAEACDH